MSRELINRIVIKKDGVYISTHSSNDTSPFYSTKNDFLTDTYNKEGQDGLDKAIIDLCFYNCDLKGNHKSIIPYKIAIGVTYHEKEFIEIRNKYDELCYKVLNLVNGLGEYKELSKEQRDQLYEEIKPKVVQARSRRNEFVVNIVKEIRAKNGLEQRRNKEMPDRTIKSITLNFRDILSEMKNKGIKFIFGIGNTMCIEDSNSNLYQIETYYHGSYLDKMIKNGWSVTFNLIDPKQTEYLNNLYENAKEVFDYNNMKDFLVDCKLENTQPTEIETIEKEEDELEFKGEYENEEDIEIGGNY